MYRWLSPLPLFLSGALMAQAVFTSSGTFVVPAGVTQITLELIGAGGDGAANGGGGGGGGAYVRGTANVTPGSSISIVVGDGGSGLATIAGGLGMLANAGGNATTVPNPNVGGGGAGGTGLGGQVQHAGGAGGGGYWTYFGGGGGGAAGPSGNGTIGGNTIAYNGSNCMTPGGSAGAGGGAPAGGGGKGAGFTDNACTATDPAADGTPYGGGGGGGNGVGSPVGHGGGGICIISWNGSTGMAEWLARTVDVVSPVFTDHIRMRNTSGTERYELIDLFGRPIWSGALVDEQDFSALPVGTYVLRVQRDGVWRSVKVVKVAA